MDSPVEIVGNESGKRLSYMQSVLNKTIRQDRYITITTVSYRSKQDLSINWRRFCGTADLQGQQETEKAKQPF